MELVVAALTCGVAFVAQRFCRERWGLHGLLIATILAAAPAVFLLIGCVGTLLAPSPADHRIPRIGPSSLCHHLAWGSGIALMIMIWAYRRSRTPLARK